MEAVCEPEVTGVQPEHPVPIHAHRTLLVMNWAEKNKTTWDGNDPGQVATARAQFDELRSRGFLAYKLTGSAQGEVIDTFDPEVEQTVLHAPMVGG